MIFVTKYMGCPSGIERIHATFGPGGLKHEALVDHVLKHVGLPLSRGGGRVFVPGDCIMFDTDDYYYELYLASTPDVILGEAFRGQPIGYLASKEPVIVLQSYRDDQGDGLTDLRVPYPLTTMLVTTRSHGVCWMFHHMWDEVKVVSVPAHTETGEHP